LVTADILPASIEVAANSPEELTLIEERLNSYSQIDDVILQKDVITQLTQWTNSLRTVGLGLTIIFLVLSLLTIISIISFKVSHQRKAISSSQNYWRRFRLYCHSLYLRRFYLWSARIKFRLGFNVCWFSLSHTLVNSGARANYYLSSNLAIFRHSVWAGNLFSALL